MTLKMLLLSLFLQGILVAVVFSQQGDIFSAAGDGNIEQAKAILRTGIDVNIRNQYGDPPLNIAASKGHMEMVKFLIRNGAEIDVQNEAGSTALLAAVYAKHWNIAKGLLAAGANPNLKTIYGDHSLNLAVGDGNMDFTKELLKKGAMLDVPNTLGLTALALSAMYNSPPEARLLLSKGANVDTQAVDGMTPLMTAVKSEFIDVVMVLLEHCPDLSLANNGKTALNMALDKQSMKIVDMIQAHPNMRCSNGGTFYQRGATRSEACHQVQCCQGKWSMTGTTFEFCDEESFLDDGDREVAIGGGRGQIPPGERFSEST